MVFGKNKTVFDLLAILCSMLTKEEERMYSVEWVVSGEEHIRDIISKYRNLLAVILNASANEYKFTDEETVYLNNELTRIEKECKSNKKDIYRLVIEIEKRIDIYSKWQNQGVIYTLKPLNTNYRKTGIANEQIVEDRILRIFDVLFPKEYGIIVFPEILGSESILQAIKGRMREYPERCSFVVVPTICRDGRNTLVVLGPGGIECLRQEKTTPAILLTEDGKAKREDLVYGNQVHLLITQELGLIAFAICAELLDPNYYRLIVDTALVDTVICSSFSPGAAAFRDTMMKGTPAKLLEIFVNSCSAKAVSRKGEVAEPLGCVHVPNAEGEYCIRDIRRECQGICAGEICYFDVLITYKDRKFSIAGIHRRCA